MGIRARPQMPESGKAARDSRYRKQQEAPILKTHHAEGQRSRFQLCNGGSSFSPPLGLFWHPDGCTNGHGCDHPGSCWPQCQESWRLALPVLQEGEFCACLGPGEYCACVHGAFQAEATSSARAAGRGGLWLAPMAPPCQKRRRTRCSPRQDSNHSGMRWHAVHIRLMFWFTAIYWYPYVRFFCCNAEVVSPTANHCNMCGVSLPQVVPRSGEPGFGCQDSPGTGAAPSARPCALLGTRCAAGGFRGRLLGRMGRGKNWQRIGKALLATSAS